MNACQTHEHTFLMEDLIKKRPQLEGLGSLALLSAVAKRDRRMAQELLRLGMPVNARNRSGITALFMAINTRDRRMVAMLLEAGANVNAQTAKGTTPLMQAVACNDAALVKLLLRAGAEAGWRAAEAGASGSRGTSSSGGGTVS